MMRHADPIRIASEIADAEGFGKVLSVESKYTTWPTGAAKPGTGWGDANEDWQYMLVQGGHPIDLMRHFLGDIKRVAAFRSHGQGNSKVYAVSLEGRDGAVGYLNLQDSFNGWYTGFEIVGDGLQTVRVDDLGHVEHRTGERKTPTEQASWGNGAYTWRPHHTLGAWKRSGYGRQLEHFAACILEGKTPYPSLRDGWLNLVVGQAIIDAYQSGTVIDLPDA